MAKFAVKYGEDYYSEIVMVNHFPAKKLDILNIRPTKNNDMVSNVNKNISNFTKSIVMQRNVQNSHKLIAVF